MLVYCLILLLLSCAINLKKDKAILYSRLFLLSLFNCFIIGYNLLYINFINEGIGIFGGLFTITALNSIFNLFIFFLSILIGCLTSFYSRKIWLEERASIYNILYNNFFFNKEKILNTMNEQYRITEYSLILLFIIIGGIFLMGSSDTISIFLSIELQSYGLYILSSIYRNSESATSAGLTYFLLGALASCFILLSTGLLYANSGCTYMDNLYIISNISEILKDIPVENSLNDIYIYSSYYLHFSFIILSMGFLFKVSAAPFHFWSPDVYDAVPTIVTTFISILPKITIFIFILDLVNHTYKNLYLYDYAWTSIFLISSLLSLIIGTVLGLTQSRIKRLYAYSTISHIGFILLALSIKSRESIQAFLFYLVQYSIANLNAFIILLCVGYSLYLYVYKKTNNDEIIEAQDSNIEYYNKLKEVTPVWKERNNSPIQLINQMKGYFHINPLLSLSLAITLFSFAGVPPLIGFFAKLMVLSASIDNGYIFMSIVAILTSVIGGVYYLAIIKQIFFEKPDYILNPNLNNLNLTGFYRNNNHSYNIDYNVNNIVLSGSLTIIISLFTSIILLFIFMPAQILNVTSIISMIIFNY
jgi:NADH-ubiquinone oxidoreductase chain 2